MHEIPKIPDGYIIGWSVLANDCNVKTADHERYLLRECQKDLRQWTRPR